jgi:hypothetical protein
VIYGVGGLVSRFLSVLMLPLYTSYVSVGDYGRIELLMSVMAVAVVVIRGGANFGFIRWYFLDKDPEYRRRLIRTVFWASPRRSRSCWACPGALRRISREAARASSSPRPSCSG